MYLIESWEPSLAATTKHPTMEPLPLVHCSDPAYVIRNVQENANGRFEIMLEWVGNEGNFSDSSTEDDASMEQLDLDAQWLTENQDEVA
jgi:hypothetical protein